MTETRQDSSKPVLDHTHSIVRRIGLAQLPLACIFLRFVQVGEEGWLGRWPWAPLARYRTLIQSDELWRLCVAQDGLFRVSDRFEVSGTMYVFFASVAFM